MIAQSGLSASQAEYVHAIWQLVKRDSAARATDIRKLLRVSGPSVTAALKSLAEKRIVNYEPYGHVTLTPEGESVAREIEHHRQILQDFFTKVLALPPALAEHSIAKMETAIGPTVYHRLTKFIEYYETCPGEKVHWVEDRGFFCEVRHPGCSTCPKHSGGANAAED